MTLKIKNLIRRDFDLLYKIQKLKKRMMRKKEEPHYSGYKKYLEGVDE